MADRIDPRGKALFTHQFPAGVLLEVFQDPQGGYVGYCDGVRSVTSARADLALRGLEKKHVKAQKTAEIIDFRKAVRARFTGVEA